jgi:hypothetical protein
VQTTNQIPSRVQKCEHFLLPSGSTAFGGPPGRSAAGAHPPRGGPGFRDFSHHRSSSDRLTHSPGPAEGPGPEAHTASRSARAVRCRTRRPSPGRGQESLTGQTFSLGAPPSALVAAAGRSGGVTGTRVEGGERQWCSRRTGEGGTKPAYPTKHATPLLHGGFPVLGLTSRGTRPCEGAGR